MHLATTKAARVSTCRRGACCVKRRRKSRVWVLNYPAHRSYIQMNNIEPDSTNHQSLVDVEPVTGKVLRRAMRMQVCAA